MPERRPDQTHQPTTDEALGTVVATAHEHGFPLEVPERRRDGMGCDERTRVYVARRRGEDLNTQEIMRCLKRYIAREVFAVLTQRVHETRP